MIWLSTVGIFLLIFIGAPLFLAMAAGALLGYSALSAAPEDIAGYLMVSMFRLPEETTILIALPLFTFAGYLLAESKAPIRLVNLSQALFGWLPGGLAFVTLLICSVFTAFSGASGITVIALGGLLLPALLKDGYDENFSLGLLTTSGCMGLLLPPSLVLILYGIVAGNNLQNIESGEANYYQVLELTESASTKEIQQAYLRLVKSRTSEAGLDEEDLEWELEELKDAYVALGTPEKRDQYHLRQKMDLKSFTIDNLFIAGILPSALMLLLLASYSLFKSRKLERQRILFSLKKLREAFRNVIWELPIPFLILGGIYGGFFTVTDAAAVTAFYILIVEVFIYRDIHWLHRLPRVTIDSLTLIGSILLILMCAMSFTGYLVDKEVPASIVEWMENHIDSRLGFLLTLNLCLLIVGFMMDIFSAIIIVVPLILPLSIKFGIHPLHLGIIFLTNLQIGFLTPPVGLELFLASSRFEKPILEIFRSTIPFLLLLVVALFLITYIPWFSMVFIN